MIGIVCKDCGAKMLVTDVKYTGVGVEVKVKPCNCIKKIEGNALISEVLKKEIDKGFALLSNLLNPK